jgi:hypothetical protein
MQNASPPPSYCTLLLTRSLYSVADRLAQLCCSSINASAALIKEWDEKGAEKEEALTTNWERDSLCQN